MNPKRLSLTVALGLLASLFVLAVALAAVELSYFHGSWQGNQVVLHFGTGSETDHAAFYVWRSTTDLPIVNGQIDTSQATRLNPASPIVNPDGPCANTGQDYQFTDGTASPSPGVYFYYLESLDCTSGGSTFYGAGDGGLRVAPNRIYMPLILQKKATP